MAEQIYSESTIINRERTSGRGLIIRVETITAGYISLMLHDVTITTLEVEDQRKEEVIFRQSVILNDRMFRPAIIRESIRLFDDLVSKWRNPEIEGE